MWRAPKSTSGASAKLRHPPGSGLQSRGRGEFMSLSDGKVRHMKALSNKNGVIAAAAMDQRGSLQKSIASGKGIAPDQVTPEMMSEFKVAVSKILTPHASAILLDPEYGLPAAKAR